MYNGWNINLVAVDDEKSVFDKGVSNEQNEEAITTQVYLWKKKNVGYNIRGRTNSAAKNSDRYLPYYFKDVHKKAFSFRRNRYR